MAIGRVPGATGIQPSIVDAKGDLIAATAADSVSRLAVGTNNQVLMADSAQATGLKYANEATATLTTTGDILYASAANTPARLAIGSTDQVLKVSGGVPSWGAAPAATFNTGYTYNGTLEGTTSTTFTDLASVVSTTVTTGTKALVSINAVTMNNSAVAGMLIGFAISGATTVSASTEYSTGGVYYFDTSTKLEIKAGSTFVVTGLTAGSNTFTMKFRRKDGSGTVNFAEKSISVVNLGS